MSEQLSPKHEAGNAERLDLSGESQRNLEKTLEAGREAYNEHSEQLDKIQQQIETQAVSGKELAVGDHQTANEGSQPIGLHHKLKADSYKRTLSRVQNQLNPIERSTSKLLHQPVVDKTSELLSRTIARPQGILYGGLFACFGSALFLYFTKHYGFRYNYLIFVMLFAGGYAFGLLVDLCRRLFSRNS